MLNGVGQSVTSAVTEHPALSELRTMRGDHCYRLVYSFNEPWILTLLSVVGAAGTAGVQWERVGAAYMMSAQTEVCVALGWFKG